MIIQTEIAEKVACVCCGVEKYATQSPYLCHNCWKNGEAAQMIKCLTQRAPDVAKRCPECDSEIVVCMMGHYCGEVTPRG